MTATQVINYLNNTRREISVRSKDGFTYKGTHVGYLDRGGSTCGILVGTNEGGVSEIIEILFTKIKSIT